jgi:hypothetical protein
MGNCSLYRAVKLRHDTAVVIAASVLVSAAHWTSYTSTDIATTSTTQDQQLWTALGSLEIIHGARFVIVVAIA